MPTTASFAPVTSGTAIKSMVQLKPFNICRIVEWGISSDNAANSIVQAELLDTGTVFGTVTASADADVMKLDGAEGAVASIAGLTLSTTGTGYTATAEGTITTVKIFDLQYLAATTSAGFQYVKQFPLGREPKLIIGNAVRVRIKASAAVNIYTYMIVEI